MKSVAMWTKYTYLNALISLICGMERNRHYTYAEIAELVGCSQDQAKKLTEQLCEITIPHLAGLGESILPLLVDETGIELHDSFSVEVSRPVRLDRMQTIATIVALRMMGVSWDDERMLALCDAVTIDAPIEHLSHIIEVSPTRYITHIMEVLAQATIDGCAVAIDYAGEMRVVEPWLFLNELDHHYVYAYCQLRDAPRMFRIDRINEATLLPDQRALHPFDEVVVVEFKEVFDGVVGTFLFLLNGQTLRGEFFDQLRAQGGR